MRRLVSGLLTLALATAAPTAVFRGLTLAQTSTSQEKPQPPPPALPTPTPEVPPEQPQPLPKSESIKDPLQTIEGEVYNLGKQQEWITIEQSHDFKFKGHSKDVKTFICNRCSGKKDPHPVPLTLSGELAPDAAAIHNLATQVANEIAKITIEHPVAPYNADQMGKKIEKALNELAAKKANELKKRKITYKPKHWAEPDEWAKRDVYGVVYALSVAFQIEKHASVTENNKTTTSVPLKGRPFEATIATAWLPTEPAKDRDPKSCDVPVEEEQSSLVPRAFHQKTMMVGLVLPDGCAPGRTCTASIVTDFDKVAGTPGLEVRRVWIPEQRDSHRHAVLTGEVVTSNEGNPQPADGPITFTFPAAAPSMSLDYALASRPQEQLTVPIEQLPARARPMPEHPSMAPLFPDNGVCIVNDIFTGNGHLTKINLDGQPVKPLAESQTLLAFRPAPGMPSGEHEVRISDGGVVKTYKTWKTVLALNASSRTLKQGESTQFQVTLSGLPPSSDYWKASAAGRDGDVVLTVKNDSPDIGTISEGNVMSRTFHFVDCPGGTCNVKGTFVASQAGTFALEATTDAHLADAPPVSVAVGKESAKLEPSGDGGGRPRTHRSGL